jgi:protein involved in polysaccharide export with SLBB domain
MMMSRAWSWLMAVLALVGAVATTASAQQSTSAPPPAAAVPAVDASYRLGPADRVRMIVFDEPNLSGEFIVNSNGALSLPLIGDVPAAGQRLEEVRSDIERRLAAGYFVKPRVSLDLISFRSFFILGEVNKPGEYPYSPGLTVFNAVAKAEGFTYRANRRRVFIKHPEDPAEVRRALDSSTLVQPGDTVRIGERFF